jgi:hypothetical protein
MSDTELKTQTIVESEGDIEPSTPPKLQANENGSPPAERVEGPVPEVRCLIASSRNGSANSSF